MRFRGARAPFLVELEGLVRLALPVVAAQVGMVLLGVIDTVMVGRLTAEALAAVALGSIFTFGTMILGIGILHGLDPLVAQAHGAGEPDEVGRSLERGLMLGLALSVPYIVLFEFSAPVLRLLHQPPQVVALAAPFIRALAPGVPALFAFVALRQTLQAMSVVRPVLLAVLAANVANFVGNLALIFGRFGLPALGVVGSGWSTTLCRYVMLVVVVWLGAPTLRPVWRRPSCALFELRPYRRLISIGFPVGIQIGLEMWVFTTAALVIGTMGAVELAGHQIAISLASLSFMVPLGIGAAAAVRVGNAIGRGDQEGAGRAARVALAAGASVMLVSALAFAALPHELARLYTPDAKVVAQAAALLPIAALFQVFDGTQAVGCGILRGIADTRVAAGINLAGYWALGLPLGIALGFRYGMGPRGLWWGLTVGLATVAVLVSWRIAARFRRAIARV